MLHRRFFVAGLLGAAVAPRVAVAQMGGRSDRLRDLPAKRIPRVAMVGLQGRDAATPFLQAFEIGLRGVGHTPGRTLVFEYHSAEGRPERVGPIVTAIARQPTDVIVATTTDVILA